MAKLISLYRDEVQQNPLGRRELPLPFDENLAVSFKYYCYIFDSSNLPFDLDGDETTGIKFECSTFGC